MQLYRRMLALPGVRTLMVLTFFARIPGTAAGMVLTLHIAVEMGAATGRRARSARCAPSGSRWARR